LIANWVLNPQATEDLERQVPRRTRLWGAGPHS